MLVIYKHKNRTSTLICTLENEQKFLNSSGHKSRANLISQGYSRIETDNGIMLEKQYNCPIDMYGNKFKVSYEENKNSKLKYVLVNKRCASNLTSYLYKSFETNYEDDFKFVVIKSKDGGFWVLDKNSNTMYTHNTIYEIQFYDKKWKAYKDAGTNFSVMSVKVNKNNEIIEHSFKLV